MAAFPTILEAGQVAVYGAGWQGVTDSGIVIQGDQRYGTIYNIWDGGAPYIYGGNKVIFDEKNVVCRLVTSNNLTYTILPFQGLVTENIPPVAP